MFPQMDFAADLSFSPATLRGHVVSTQKLIFFGPLSRNSPNVAQAKLAPDLEVGAASTAGGGELRVRVAEPKFCAGYADAHGSEIAPWLTMLPGTSPLSHVGFVEGLPVAPVYSDINLWVVVEATDRWFSSGSGVSMNQ